MLLVCFAQWTLLGLLMLHCAVSADTGEECRVVNNNPKLRYTYHSDTDGSYVFCCVERKCDPGFMGLTCTSTDPYGSKCKLCPADTYNPSSSVSSDGLQCRDKQKCFASKGLKILSNGSHTEDRKCTCDETKGFFNSKKINPIYCAEKRCPAGQHLQKDGKCVDCPLNYFKENNKTHVCMPKTDCEKLGLQFMNQNYTSRTEDNRCRNITEADTDVPNVVTAEIEITTIAAVTNAEKNPWTIVIIAIIIILLVLIIVLVVLGLLCKRRTCKKKKERNELSVTYVLPEVDPNQTGGEEHDETSLLKKVSGMVVKLPPRTPSETDERDHLHKSKSSLPGASNYPTTVQSFQRQTTVDSGFCNGNSSGSDRGSAEFEMYTAVNTPSTSGLKAEAPIFPEHSSLPANINQNNSKGMLDCGGMSMHCDSADRKANSPNLVNNVFHLYGPNSMVQVASGENGQNAANSTTGPTCASCASCAVMLGTPENEEPQVIIERGPTSTDNSDNESAQPQECSFFRRTAPSETIEPIQA